MPYTSGTTGQPKGCMHTHRSVMYQTLATGQWVDAKSDSVVLAVLPFFHVTGMQSSMNMPLYNGNTVILLPRWDRDVAAQLHRALPGDVVDVHPDDGGRLPRQPRRSTSYDLSTLVGSAAAARRCRRRSRRSCWSVGLTYIEGYGLSETIAATHINPAAAPKQQCLGIPIFDIDSRVVDPETLEELRAGRESARSSRTVRRCSRATGTTRRPTRQCFVEIDGKRFFRTGDLGAHRRGRLLLHGRSAEAHDQRVGLQGLAGRGRGA